MSDRPVSLLLEDIWDSISKIQSYVTDLNQEAFSKDSKTVDAVVRNLEVIGEATARLPDEFRNRYDAVEWRKVIGLRNRIIHGYFDVDLAIIWQILQDDLLAFRTAVESIRRELSADDS